VCFLLVTFLLHKQRKVTGCRATPDDLDLDLDLDLKTQPSKVKTQNVR